MQENLFLALHETDEAAVELPDELYEQLDRAAARACSLERDGLSVQVTCHAGCVVALLHDRLTGVELELCAAELVDIACAPPGR